MCGMFSIVPIAVLLAISFFVLVALQQIKPGALRGFGLAVFVILIMAIALLVMKNAYKRPLLKSYYGVSKIIPK